jgi:thiosulfate/3-mercaptopyruvate sulfurtransferase
VDEDVSAYDGGHVKGAVRLDWTQELQQPEARDLIDRDDFAR